MARDLEKKRITILLSLQRVGKVGGSSRSDTDGHHPSLPTPTRLGGSPMARDLGKKQITRVMSDHIRFLSNRARLKQTESEYKTRILQ